MPFGTKRRERCAVTRFLFFLISADRWATFCRTRSIARRHGATEDSVSRGSPSDATERLALTHRKYPAWHRGYHPGGNAMSGGPRCCSVSWRSPPPSFRLAGFPRPRHLHQLAAKPRDWPIDVLGGWLLATALVGTFRSPLGALLGRVGRVGHDPPDPP